MAFKTIFITSLVALASAQAPPDLPQCGSSIMLPAIGATGCGFTDSACLCKNPAFLDAIKVKLPTVCSSAADLAKYNTFVNGQCKGQPGFPLGGGSGAGSSNDAASAVAANVAAPASSSASGGSPTASGSASAAATAATAKPAVSTGAASRTSAWAGVGAVAGFAAFALV